MKKFTRIALFVSVLLTACLSAPAQNPNSFASGDGGFSIGIPPAGVTVEDKDLNEGGLTGSGKVYQWSRQGEYFYQVGYYKFNDFKMTPALKTTFLASFKEGFLEEAKKNKYPYSEAPYAFQTHKGIQMKIVFPFGAMTARAFVTATRLYFIGVAYAADRPGSDTAKILDSFRLLDTAALKTVKIEEATPEPLPQEPAAKKSRSDAEDENLKGKVKSIIEDTVSLPGTRRERSGEKYYDTRGNLTKEIAFDEGYPMSVDVWGSIDGKRVSRSGYIDFDTDQRPAGKEIIMSMMESPRDPDKIAAEPAERDPRYDSRYAYKYDGQGRLIEKSYFENNGQLIDRTTYTYTPGRRDERTYGDGEEEQSHTTYLVDAAGNETEVHDFNEQGVADRKSVIKYEFDAAGNWIVRRAFEKKTVRGKAVLKPLNITYRTITYY